MRDSIALSSSQFRHKRWAHPKGFRAFSQHQLIPLAAKELSQAVMEYPLLVAKTGSELKLYALLGLDSEQNDYLDDSTGEWKAHYVPELVRLFPFSLIPKQGDTVSLAIDSSCISDSPADLPLFDQTGNPSALVSNRFEALKHHTAGQLSVGQCLKGLAKYGLLRPWEAPTSGCEDIAHKYNLQVLYNPGLNVLSPDQIFELFKRGSLWLAQYIALSYQNTRHLQQHRQSRPLFGNIKHELPDMNDAGIDFDGLF